MYRLFTFLVVMFSSSWSLAGSDATIMYDRAHGQPPLRAGFKQLANNLDINIAENTRSLNDDVLAKSALLYLRVPNQAFSSEEKTAIITYLNKGGSLLLVIDEERRQSLAKTGVNDFITPFGIMLTGDTPYLHNTGGVTLSGEVTSQRWELPFSGGRAVAGGTPFAFQLDAEGKVNLPFATYKKLSSGGRIIVLGEGMVTAFLGTKDGLRLSGEFRNPRKTTYWGKDSHIAMQEIVAWLLNMDTKDAE